MTSNTVVAKRDVCKCVGFSIQIERAAVAESVALFTHCRAVQLSERCQPSQRTHTRIERAAVAESVALFTHCRLKTVSFLSRTSQNVF